MTMHFSDDEFVEAIDGHVTGERRDHLLTCADCARQVEQLRASATTLRTAEEHVPDPPAFFWTQLKARVRSDVEASRARRWFGAERWQVAMASAAAVLIAAVALVPVEAPSPNDAGGDAAWEDVVEMAGALSQSDVQDFAAVVAPAATSIEDLTPTEREAFVSLLRMEMGSLE